MAAWLYDREDWFRAEMDVLTQKEDEAKGGAWLRDDLRQRNDFLGTPKSWQECAGVGQIASA